MEFPDDVIASLTEDGDGGDSLRREKGIMPSIRW